MSNSYAAILQNLCHDYMSHRLSFEDYRKRRRSLLTKIDEQFNGIPSDDDNELTAPLVPQDGGNSGFGINRLCSNLYK